MAVAQPLPKNVTHVDRPDLRETFADSVHSLVWDGQTARVELCVTRYPEAPSSGEAESHRYPVCRLVLTPQAVVDLSNRLQQTMVVMMQTGAMSPPNPPASKNS